MLKAVCRGLSAVAIAVALLGAPEGRAQEKVTVRLDFTPAGPHAALHLAKIKGWFKEAGIDIDIQDGKGSLNSIQLVGAGQIDIGQVSMGAAAVARQNGLMVKSIAGYARRNELAILVDKTAGITKAEHLAGKRVVLFSASPWMPFIDPFLKKAGLDRNKVTLVFTDPSAMYSVYGSGQVDGIATLAPFSLPIIEKTRAGVAVLASDVGIAYPGFGLIARDETIAKKPEVLAKVVAISNRAWTYIYGGRIEEGVEAILKERDGMKLDPDVLRGQLVQYQDFSETPATKGKPLGWQAEADWVAAIASMEEAGVIKPGSKPSDYYTNQFVEAAK